MKKLLKLFLIIFIIFIVVFFGFITYLKNSINLNSLKQNINSSTALILEEHNKHYHFKDKELKFSINGQINIVFPFKLVINNIEIKNIQYKDVLINGNIKKIEIKLNIKDLLNKKITPKDVNILGSELYIDKNKLDDFYYKLEKVKKIVKLEDNEVFGVKDKLKSLLTSTNDNKVSEIEEGYKEVEIEEEIRYDLDNKKARLVLVDIINNLSKNLEIKKNIHFSNVFITIINNKNIEKELKNINGSIKFNDKEIKTEANFLLNNINGYLALLITNSGNKYNYNLEIKNNIQDNISIKLTNDNLLINNFKDINSNIEVNFNTQNLNNLIQWLFSANSKIYNVFNYKKQFTLKTNIIKNNKYYNIKNMVVDAEDIKLKSNINFTENNNNIVLDVEKINFDNFTINLYKSNFINEDKNINIYKYDTFDKLLSSLKTNETVDKEKITTFSLNIKELIYKNNILKDSTIEIEKNNKKYKIKKLNLNLKDLKIVAEEPKEQNGFYYNNLTITGENFDIISKMINADNIVKINKFSLNSNIFINDAIIYCYDYILKNDKNEIITNGNMEYSLKNNNNYIALTSNFNDLIINHEKKQVSTLKEKFLWLNNISSNVFVDLKINNLIYNEKKIQFNSKIHYYPGFIHLYDIQNITTNNFKNITGDILLGLGKKEPILNVNLSIEEINYKGDLINYVFNIEKYKNILLETEINKELENKYWIKKLFLIPTLEEINGQIDIKTNNILINNSHITDFNFISSIQNGILNLDNFKFNGFGGFTELKGSVDLKKSRNINLILTDTIYDIEEIFKLFSEKNNDSIKGTIGIGGLFRANGFNESVLLSSMNFSFKFISNNLYIKKLGLEELKRKLDLIYSDDVILNNFEANKIILNDSGTTFKNVEGNLSLTSGVNNLIIDSSTDSITNKLIFKIDNSGKTLIIDAINTSIITTKVGDTILPLYTMITFKEDFSNKAKLKINTEQIDEYIKKVKETKNKTN